MINAEKYYWIRSVSVPRAYALQRTNTVSWGIDPHYLSEEEIALLGRGRFQPEKMRFSWNRDAGRFEPLFARAFANVFTASVQNFELFDGLIGRDIDKFPLFIDGNEYISFIPKRFFPIFDGGSSEFRTTREGDLIKPKRMKIRRPPDDAPPIFGIEFNKINCPFVVVSQAFKLSYDEVEGSGLIFDQVFP